MFRFTKKKRATHIIAPISGHTVNIERVPDEVFSKKMLGEGIAIQTSGAEVVAPADGKINFIMDTGHAFGIILKNGIEILIHIGLETANLKGEGFRVLAESGAEVTVGTPIISLDRDYIESKGYSMITMVIISNSAGYRISDYTLASEVLAGESSIITFI